MRKEKHPERRAVGRLREGADALLLRTLCVQLRECDSVLPR